VIACIPNGFIRKVLFLELHFPAGGIIHCQTSGIGMSEERDQLIEHAPPAVNRLFGGSLLAG
jgi:hypothetical protein